MPTEQQVATEALRIANAALPAAGTARAHEPSKVPSPRPDEYVTVAVVRRPGGKPRSGRYSTTGWSLYVMAASARSEENARNWLEKIRAAFESQVITVAGVASTPVKFDSARPVGPDNTWSSGVNTYTFTL